MEKKRKARTVLRGLFTRVTSQLKELMDNDEKDILTIKATMELLQKRYSELSDLDASIFEMLLDEEKDERELETETAIADEYTIKYNTLRAQVQGLEDATLVETRFADDCQSVTANSQSGSKYSIRSGQLRKTIKLPVLELKKFNDELKNWLPFWSQFQKIDRNETLDNSDKFQYLIQCMVDGTKPREIVESYPATDDNYVKALSTLKSRYGDRDLLIEVYIRELLKLILQNVKNKNESLASLYDQLESQLRSLESLGIQTTSCAAMLLPLIESALPFGILKAWQRSRRKNSEDTTSKARLDSLLEFLKGEVEGELKLNLAMSGLGISSSNQGKIQPKRQVNLENTPTAATLLTDNKYEITCIFCNGSHKNVNCRNAHKMNIKDRREIAHKKRVCYICLRIGHPASKCRDSKKCSLCGRKHHVLLCDNETKQEQQQTSNSSQVKCTETTTTETLASLTSSPCVLLQTLRVKIHGNGVVRTTRAIIDTASQRSYIQTSLAEKMGYQSEEVESIQHSLFGGIKTDVRMYNVYNIILSNLMGSYSCNFKVLNQSTICGNIAPVKSGPWIEELRAKNILLSDNADGPIEVLIGADIAGKLLTGKKNQLDSGLVALETKLGWTLMGRVPGQTTRNESTGMVVTTLLIKEACISDLWSFDVLGIEDPLEKKAKEEIEEATHQHFLQTVSVEEDGRYMVHLPWFDNHPALPSNYDLSERRLQTLVKKLKKEGYYEEYDRVFKDWEAEGIIEQVPEGERQKPGHYLPHHHVVKLNSTTKVRPVFNASAKEGKHPSLNDCLAKGINLIELIPLLLTRFRLGKIGIIADIKKAFLQISVLPNDRDFLRFIWQDQLTGETKIYRHCRVVFGVVCSPFLLGAVIQLHIQKVLNECNMRFSDNDRKLIEKLAKSYYVDNCVTSLEKTEDIEKFVNISKTVMAKGKFDLRGWYYTDHECSEEMECNVLGLNWNRQSDTFSICMDWLEKINLDKVTKRTILSVAHRIFDPIGFTCCVTLLPKLMLQETCRLQLGWDQEVPQEIKKKFTSWIRDLKDLSEIKVSRWIGTEENQGNHSIHVFSDATQLCYSTAVFLRVTTYKGIEVHLLQAKARIAPNKPKKIISIPRMELLGATIGARLYKNVINELNMKNVETHFWSDSSTVVAWINRENNWDIFVSNRVKEIKMLTNNEAWKHIPGHNNPADLPSRGCSVRKLLESKWWEGPLWLHKPSSEWPNCILQYNEEEIVSERKKIVISTLINNSHVKQDNNWYYLFFSRYSKIIKMVAWMKRFVRNCREKLDKISGSLTVSEYDSAEKYVIKLIQNEFFTGETRKLIEKLNTFTDEEGLMRVRSTITNSGDNFDFRKPILLPGQHEVVKRLIMEKHEDLCHVGGQGLLCALRERYWILGGRRLMRSVLSRCVKCKRNEGRKIEVQAPPLPSNRVKEAAPFEVTGVDLAGPVFLRGKIKAWICLYTCAIYRAVHIELLSSSTTSCFLKSLRRFIARRGRPNVIYSDNGRNFVGAENLFKQLDWNEIQTYSTAQRIQWLFNPPTAAWWGGWWERIIGMLKRLLRKILGRAALNYEELYTVLCDCEGVLNARPLTYMSEDSKDLVPLTPSMFLQGIRENGIPDCDNINSKDLTRRMKYRQTISEQLRRRFRAEYLGLLTQKNKRKPMHSISVGDIVLISSDEKKRLDWPLAVVEEVILGRDGLARLFRLRNSSGRYLRPLQRIYPLEISSKEDELPIEQIQLTKGEDSTSTRSGRVVKVPERFQVC